MAYYAPGTIIPSKLHLYQTNLPKRDFLPLLELPGEIRNKIYDSVFEECLVCVRIGSQRQVHDENDDRPHAPSQKQPLKQCGKQIRSEVLKPVERQLGRNILPKHLEEDLKEQKCAPVLSQEQSRTQKRSKPRRHQNNGRGGPLRIRSEVISSLDSRGNGIRTRYRVPLNFLFSCRQIYNEALSAMYSKTIFSFSQTKAINRFLSATPLRALQVIEDLHISHATAGEPELTKNRKFKLITDQNWLTTCRQTREKMTGLKNLRLHLILHDWPSQLSLREEWAQPILSLRGNGLDRVDATLFHPAFSEERLNEAARMLEIAMMSKEGQIVKSQQERRMIEAKKKKAEYRPPRVLVIKMDNSSTTREPQEA